MEETKKTTTAWLMWVGSDSYEKIEDWASEAVALGISKRLPSAGVGKSLMTENTVIFVAHDEGHSTDCPACPGKLECPACRKRQGEIQRINTEIEQLAVPFGSVKRLMEIGPAGIKRSFRTRNERVCEIETEMATCALCRGKLTVEGATGGHVLLKSGTKMDYRQYNYWLHQPTKFDPTTVAEKHMCENCGGTGQIPDAQIFGLFVPETVEYIVKGDETEDELAKVAKFSAVPFASIKLETERKCGYRKAGGVYAVTSPIGTPEGAAVAKKLMDSGLVDSDGIELHGNFIRLLNPVKVSEKRFRGIKHFDPSAELDEEAAHILEALK